MIATRYFMAAPVIRQLSFVIWRTRAFYTAAVTTSTATEIIAIADNKRDRD
jgi:hypothetical protein